jgi:glycosyltransferase involved in cell wall biosynthesis
MKKILYIGNKLSKHGNTATSIETLGAFLESESYSLLYASDKKNKVLRLLDMLFKTIKYKKDVFVVLIDVYSTTNFWYALIISQLCRLLKLPYVAKLHGGNLPYRLNNNRNSCNKIFGHSKYNVAPSMYLFHPFAKHYPQNTIYIPNTINLLKYDYLERITLKPRILWVRSLSSIYNPYMAIKCAALLKNKYPTVSLTMVGPDKENLLQDCKNLAESLHVTVAFLGKVEKEDWIKLSRDFSIFINTSNYDNMPISIIEAMALGLPVVTTNVGGIPFLVENEKTALLVNIEDTEEMANAIDRLLSDNKLSMELSKNARSVIESLDWEIVKKKWKVILESLQ